MSECPCNWEGPSSSWGFPPKPKYRDPKCKLHGDKSDYYEEYKKFTGKSPDET